MRLSYKLTKRTTKTEKIKKSLKILEMYKIINFKTIRSKLTASSDIIHSILINKLIRPISFLLQPKEGKKQKTANSKKIEREKCHSH